MLWQDALAGTIDAWDKKAIVVSPDIDGILSALLFKKRYGSKIVGIYSTVDIILLNGATRADIQKALWLDHDVTHPSVKCIGQHLLRVRDDDVLSNVAPESFNPNEFFDQTYVRSFKGLNKPGRDKYPFGTIHFLMEALNESYPTRGSEAYALFAHADGTWANAIKYSPNCNRWRDLMFAPGGFIDDVTTDELARRYVSGRESLAAHQRLVRDLVSHGMRRGGSASAGRDHALPELWRELQGVQSVGYPKSGDLEKRRTRIEAATACFDRVYDYLASLLRWDGALPASHISDIVFGDLTRMGPHLYQSMAGSLDAFLRERDSFSHAIIDYRTIQFTNGIAL